MATPPITPEDFEPTNAALADGVGTLPLNPAIEQIEGWQARLTELGTPEPVAIAGDLGRLKRLLGAGVPDGDAIRATLTTLGEQVGFLADGDAPAGIRGALRTLGRLLRESGDATYT